MQTSDDISDLFDDDFEITYEEDPPVSLEMDHPVDNLSPKTAPDKRRSERAADFDLEVRKIVDDYDDSSYDLPEEEPVPVRQEPKHCYTPRKAVKKKAPVYGTKSIFRSAQLVARIVSALIGASVVVILAIEFWRGSVPYGSLSSAIKGEDLTFFTYTGITALIVIYALSSFLSTIKKTRFRKGSQTYKVDMGRGTGFYISIYILSYLAFIAAEVLPTLPDLQGLEFLNGITGALDVFGSMHNMLLGLCLAGVVSCIARKHMR